jgi:uncharacterized protein YlxW (UPF0749 family)
MKRFGLLGVLMTRARYWEQLSVYEKCNWLFKAVQQSMEVAEQTTEVLSLIRDHILELQRRLDCLKTDIRQLKAEIAKLKGG